MKVPYKEPLNMTRDDHLDHHQLRYIKENKEILARIEKINWLKQKSVLELGELLAQHKDK